MRNHMSNAVLWAAIGSAFVLLPSLAMAQSETEFEGPLKEQLEEYWSAERDLPVLKKRLYTREGTLELGLYTGLMSSDPFYFYLPIGLHAGYFFSDSFGVEFSGQYSLSFTTDLADFFESRGGDAFDVATDGGDEFIYRANVVAKWHPLYGKVAAFQRKLTHLDFNLVGGVGVVGYNRPGPNRNTSETGLSPELVFGAGLSFFASDKLTVRLDGRGYIYAGPEFETDEFTTDEDGNATTHGFFDRLTVPLEFLVGVSYAL